MADDITDRQVISSRLNRRPLMATPAEERREIDQSLVGVYIDARWSKLVNPERSDQATISAVQSNTEQRNGLAWQSIFTGICATR
jgi:hypothetical protein